MEKKIIILTDSGDTIIDEGTEIREIPDGIVKRAECIPGARESMLELYDKGYTIALVADGLAQSFENVMKQHGLSHIFASETISELMGVHKPSALMFEDAMKKLGLTEEDKKRVVMVGNNIKRDIIGANQFGIKSVLLTWSDRYCMIPENDLEKPDYEIATPAELPALIDALEKEWMTEA